METRLIDSIIVGERFRRDLGDFVERLAASIRDLGLIHPIVILPDGQLLDGNCRLRACKLLGWETIPVTIMEERRAGS